MNLLGAHVQTFRSIEDRLRGDSASQFRPAVPER